MSANTNDPGSKQNQDDQVPHEPINTPENVPDSNDEKIDQDFPGYPHYPAKDDLLNPDNHNERVDIDVENMAASARYVRMQENEEHKKQPSGEDVIDDQDEDEIGIVEGTEADVTEDDLLILGEVDGRREDLDDVPTADSLSEITSENLDIPGTELDDANEMLGEEDEENNYYSLGGDKDDILEPSIRE